MKFLLLLIVSSIAMIVMHSLSTLIGAAFTLIVPKLWTQIITIILFWGMGIWAIY
jgi:putative Ca2+/H+ antiporter (TMEM165/GDT1 family)